MASEKDVKLARAQRKLLEFKAMSKETQQRVSDAGLSVLGAAIGSVVPAYLIAADPAREYLDENRTIETEAVVAAAAGIGGVAAYVMDVDYATPLMVTGVAVMSSYMGKVARQRAQANVAGA